jgi:hypothetical protein
MHSSNNASSDNEADAEQMRLAFEAFMLQGKGNDANAPSGDASTNNTTITTSSNSKKKKKKKRPSTGPSPQKTQTTTLLHKQAPSPNKLDQTTKKRYYQLLRTLSNKIQQSWFEIDDEILAVLENIVSIRGRLPLEWKLLNSYNVSNTTSYDEIEMEKDDWKCAGFRGKIEAVQHPLHLQQNDIQLALDHDLEQHEKMIGAVRSLISELSECHESIGRLVDTILTFHLDCHQDDDDNNIRIDREDENNERSELDLQVHNSTEFFHALSTELYRKQCMIPTLIESINDQLLGVGSDQASTENSPLTVAKRCHKAWARQIDDHLLKWILKLGT